MTLISKILADKSEAAVKSGVAEPQKNCGERRFDILFSCQPESRD